ncbi:hypothetical protein GOODEAATRI_016083 [Goodea atripinnis]|uniref:Uncharacterized protein n=1 Tax=Goodea atripinnis TaxID=208336 RepID=A0ABV0MI77_9TELE
MESLWPSELLQKESEPVSGGWLYFWPGYGLHMHKLQIVLWIEGFLPICSHLLGVRDQDIHIRFLPNAASGEMQGKRKDTAACRVLQFCAITGIPAVSPLFWELSCKWVILSPLGSQ